TNTSTFVRQSILTMRTPRGASKTSRWHARHAAANCAVKSTNASQSSPTLNLPQPRTKQPLLHHDLRNRNCVPTLRMTDGPAAICSHQRTPSIRRVRRCRPKTRSEDHTSELQSRFDLVCHFLLE